MKIRTIVLGLGAGLLLAVASVPAHAASKNFVALMNGGQETPPTTSNSFGVAFFTFDSKTGQLCYRVTYMHLDGGQEVASHIHGPAVPGQSANVLVGLAESGSPKNNCITPDATTLKTLKKALPKGQLYINVHSAQNPGGEIRGQILPTK
ncbi:MAG TPA: CHRD domain-containing protein [Candidatus Nitrosopolaris sp.]|nr:CHRD domain-containing protein [Candidatus Nitrosopolaris sp.]